MQDLINRAAAMGLHFKFVDLGRLSGQLRSNGLVYINYRKSLLTQRVTAAHEIGHWDLGHDWTNAHDKAADERQADLYAAHLLISPVEYEIAERLYGHHPGTLALELGVTRRLVELWQQGREPEMRATA